MKTKILSLLSLLVIVGCGKASSSSPTVSKDLFSIWTASDLSLTFDIRNQSFGSFGFQFTLSSGEKCNTTILIAGTQASGSYSISGSTYVGGTGGGSDPGCASLNETGSYTNANAVLTLCSSGTCLNYQ